MISLCLQCYPGDMDAALELTQLICDLEPVRRQETEFFLVYRRDCPYQIQKHFEAITASKFGRVCARQARNFANGWAEGCNLLAGDSFMEVTLLRREGICQNEAFLLFEPDCIPLSADWLDRLSAEWERVKALGKEAFGHWHDLPNDGLHMNGNAVYRTDYYDYHPDMIIGSGTQGWDYFYRHKILAISVDSNLIYQHWNRYGITKDELAIMGKNGERPVFFHGIKTPDGRHHIRRLLLPEIETA
jgi:hypothetical protein